MLSKNAETAQVSPLVLLISLALCILNIVAAWKIFEKAGQPGWACLIPFYNTYKQFEFVCGNGWKFLLLLIPFFNIVYAIMFQFKLAKVFGKGTAFGFGLWLLPFIFNLILAFGDAEYLGTIEDLKK